MPLNYAIIPAAGTSARMGEGIPKQYVSLKGRPVLWHTLNRLAQTQLFTKMIVAAQCGDMRADNIVSEFPNTETAVGGATRMLSVRNSLLALEGIAQDDDWVFVHDAARPFVSVDDIHRLYDAIQHDPIGGLLVQKLSDTIKRIALCEERSISRHCEERSDEAISGRLLQPYGLRNDESARILHTLNRDELVAALTPQAFRYKRLKDAINTAITNQTTVTDESSAIEQLGHQPLYIESTAPNIKLTHPTDWKIAEALCE